MIIDNATICPITDDDEFFDTLKTYETEWFIGNETDIQYSQNVLNNKEFLFSLYKDTKNVIFSYLKYFILIEKSFKHFFKSRKF